MGYLDNILNSLGGEAGSQPPNPAPGQRGIVDIANRYAGESTGHFYHPDPTRACASFVSTVLRDAGVLQQNQGSPSAHVLESFLPTVGAQQVASRGTPIQSALKNLQPGDVVFFQGPDGATHHTGIYAGEGKITDTSSAAQVVKNRAITAPGYGTLSAYRPGSANGAPAGKPVGYLDKIIAGLGN